MKSAPVAVWSRDDLVPVEFSRDRVLEHALAESVDHGVAPIFKANQPCAAPAQHAALMLLSINPSRDVRIVE
jgi:hypothetical protein